MTKTKIVYRIPGGCTAAIKDARNGFLILHDALNALKPYPGFVYQAAQAGAAQDSARIVSIANGMKAVNARIRSDTTALETAGILFNGDAALCKKTQP